MKESGRNLVKSAKRVVIKAGSRILVDRSGKPDKRQIRQLVNDIASAIKTHQKDIVFVSSGAIASGMEALGLKKRPKTLPDLQMAAAVGQVRLMTYYQELFGEKGLSVAQVLLTHDDLRNRTRHLNARNTLNRLLSAGILPIINENDVVAVDDIKVGDNDILASLVALLIDAEVLLLLTSADGLRAQTTGGKTRRVSHLPSVTKEALKMVLNTKTEFSTGGMRTKLQAAETVLRAGGVSVIAPGRKKGVVQSVLKGEDIGTYIGGAEASKTNGIMPVRKRWIAFFERPQGALVVDAGAREAISGKGKSLLPIGILRVEGKFAFGAMVNIKADDGALVGRGLVDYSSAQIEQIKGKSSAEMTKILGVKDYNEVIHRDNMVVLA